MSTDNSVPEAETGFDQVLAFSIPHRDARGRIVRLGPALDAILSAHDYPAPIRLLLGEALVLTALMGSLMKDRASQLTFQAQAEGAIVDLLVCDYRQGELRGYVRHDTDRLDQVGANPNLEALFGSGYLGITFDLETSAERYQGIVPLEGESLARACESYFMRSEQIPTLIRVGMRNSGKGAIAAGLLIQHFPDGEEGRERLHAREENPEWEHVATLGGSIRHDELVDADLSLEQIVWRLFHEEREVRVEPQARLTRGCRCTVAHYRKVLAQFPAEELDDMRDQSGTIPVECAFCSKVLDIDV